VCLKAFRYNTGGWETNRQTDRIPISIGPIVRHCCAWRAIKINERINYTSFCLWRTMFSLPLNLLLSSYLYSLLISVQPLTMLTRSSSAATITRPSPSSPFPHFVLHHRISGISFLLHFVSFLHIRLSSLTPCSLCTPSSVLPSLTPSLFSLYSSKPSFPPYNCW